MWETEIVCGHAQLYVGGSFLRPKSKQTCIHGEFSCPRMLEVKHFEGHDFVASEISSNRRVLFRSEDNADRFCDLDFDKLRAHYNSVVPNTCALKLKLTCSSPVTPYLANSCVTFYLIVANSVARCSRSMRK